jgi:hypothetical protein
MGTQRCLRLHILSVGPLLIVDAVDDDDDDDVDGDAHDDDDDDDVGGAFCACASKTNYNNKIATWRVSCSCNKD